MAGRVLTAGRAPGGATPDPQTDVVNVIWSCLIELWKIGERYHRLRPKRDTLWKQLAEPDAWQNPHYLAAAERFRRWDAELAKHDMIADGIERNLVKHYGKLSATNRQELVAGGGWSRLEDPNEWAKAMRERGLAYSQWPEGEPGGGFDRGPLSTWIEGQMQRERDQIAAGVARLMVDSWSRREAA